MPEPGDIAGDEADPQHPTVRYRKAPHVDGVLTGPAGAYFGRIPQGLAHPGFRHPSLDVALPHRGGPLDFPLRRFACRHRLLDLQPPPLFLPGTRILLISHVPAAVHALVDLGQGNGRTGDAGHQRHRLRKRSTGPDSFHAFR